MAVRPKTTASIPTRYETTLLVGPRERNGFGQRTHRFSGLESDTPGPGSYSTTSGSNQGVVVRSAVTCGSVSAKGFTGLVSRTDRFGYLEREAERSASKPGPGTHFNNPGPHGGPHGGGGGGGGGPHTRATTAPVPVHLYKVPKYFRGQEPATQRAPGPGQYDVVLSAAATREGRDKSKRPSHFMADQSERFKFDALKAAGPAPTSYHTHQADCFLRTQGRVSTSLPDCTFRSRSVRAQYIEVGASKAVPGPGSYDPNASSSSSAATGGGGGSVVVVPKNSSMFSNTNLDRFGNQYHSKTARLPSPGPGSVGDYGPAVGGGGGNSSASSSSVSLLPSRVVGGGGENNQYSRVAAPGGGSPGGARAGPRSGSAGGLESGGLPAFRFKGHRFEDTLKMKLERGPGPAFYQPLQQAPKKSFILNAASKWV